MPGRMAARVRNLVFALFGGAALAAGALALAQRPFAASFFEFLQPREFSGVLSAKPHPALAVLRPGKTGELPVYSRYYLVAQGKFGFEHEAAKWDGQAVTLRGKLIYRDDQTMIEVEPASITPRGMGAAPAHSRRAHGTFTLRGEIVDSKCFLGVMNPGNLKTHRACAVRCLAGGIPPLFIVRQSHDVLYLLLVSTSGESVNQQVLDLAARPLEIEGEVVQEDNLLVLRADPGKYRLLD